MKHASSFPKKRSRNDKQIPYASSKWKTPKKSGGSDGNCTMTILVPGPIWTRPPGNGPIHPELDKQLCKPFLSTIFIGRQGNSESYKYPLGNGEYSKMGGLKERMRFRFFHGTKIKGSSSSSKKYRGSTAEKGSTADKSIEIAIATGVEPPVSFSSHSYAVWSYWKKNGHTPVLAQLPVVLVNANLITAGDYFTLHKCPLTGRQTLWLWELKTGYKTNTRKPDMMAEPLGHVPLTPRNRFQLQLLLTKIAYEKELGMKIDHWRVIHVWEHKDGKSCDVEVLEPSELDPPYWAQKVDENLLYSKLKKAPKQKTKRRKKDNTALLPPKK